MSTKSERTEIEVIKNEISNIKTSNERDHANIMREICGIKEDIKAAMANKADKEEVDRIKNQLTWAATLLIASFVGIIVFLIQKHII